VLLNQQATRTAILSGIKDLAKRVTSDDMVYFFFAGHAVTDSQDRAYFMPYDAAPNEPDDKGFNVADFLRKVDESLSVKHLIYFIDACYAGAAVTQAGVIYRSYGSVSRPIMEYWKNQPNPRNMGILSASAGQKSIEDPALGHGVFTFYLLRGLGGEARRPGENIIRAGDLFDYVRRQVELRSRRLGEVQTPVIGGAFDSEFALTVTTDPKPPVSEVGATTDQLNVELIQRIDEALPPSMTRLLTTSDLRGKTKWQLEVMRNEIYARHGRKFVRPDLREYFLNQSWYRPLYESDEFKPSWLSNIEHLNVAQILRAEKALVSEN
jgi:hypothetical protein